MHSNRTKRQLCNDPFVPYTAIPKKTWNSKRLRNGVETNAENQTIIFHVLTAVLEDTEAPFVLGNAPDPVPLAASAALIRIL